MKAAAIREHGDISKITVEERPDPAPDEGDAIVEVRAAGLNHLDIWVRKGRPGMALSMPHVLGSDAAGVVVELGPGTTGFDVDTEVIINPGLWCGQCEYCLRGEQSVCVSYGILGMTRPGTFAERVAVPAASLQPKPPHLSWEEAGVLSLAHLTAYRMLMTRAALAPGETVLIHGIGGGVAVAALQICTAVGARSIVTSSSDEKLERARTLGATDAINYTVVSDVAQAVKDITSGRGADIAFDTVGAATWPVDFDAVRRGGRVVLCGVTSGAVAETNLQKLYWRQLSLLGSTMGSCEDYRQLINLVDRSGMKPVIDNVWSLDDAPKATERMEEGKQFGKIGLRLI